MNKSDLVEKLVNFITKVRCIMRTGRIIQCSVFAVMLFLSGCATTLTEAGHKIKVLHDGNSSVISDCVKLDPVKGETRSLLSGGDYGVVYATHDARNKAALIPEADTLVIDDNASRIFGGEISGTAYNCNRQRIKPIHEGSAAVDPQDAVFKKAAKCQAKGGVWINNQCVIQVE